MIKILKWGVLAIFFAVLALFPKLFGVYFTNVLVTFTVFALFAVSYNLLLGYTGLLSFGHAMFFGIGAYGTAFVLDHFESFPLIPALLVGVLAAVVLAIILCPIMVRVSGTAFAMLHLAFGQLMYVLCLKLRVITGGEDGIGGFEIPPLNIPGIGSIDMTDPVNFYYFAMVILIISMWILWFFTKTPFGSIMISIRDNPNRVSYLGFKVAESKAVIYTISGGFAGVAGSIFALFQDMISANGAFNIMVSFTPLMMTIVGGIGSFFGPIVGAGIFGIVEELTSRYTDRVELVMGLILILIVVYAPMGFMGFVNFMRDKLSSWLTRQKIVEETP